MKRRFELTIEAPSNWFETPEDDAQEIRDALANRYDDDVTVTVRETPDEKEV